MPAIFVIIIILIGGMVLARMIYNDLFGDGVAFGNLIYLSCSFLLLLLVGWLSIAFLQYQKKLPIDTQTVQIINMDDIQIAVLKNRQIINLTERYGKIFCCQELEFKEYPVFVYGILFMTDFPYEMKEIPTQKPVKLKHVDPC
jgi:hypothetical protein